MGIPGTSLFVKALKSEGVDTLFAYPGGYIIDILDELYHDKYIELILPRHEQALVHAADAYARSTGRTGVCLVTSGPGATNLVTGIATANYDSVPLVCFTGQVPTRLIGNDAFQEVDIVGITRSITKHSIVVTDRASLGRIIKEAFYIARAGKPGPVLVDLPSDIMKEMGSALYPKSVNIRSYKPNTDVHIGQIKRAITRLKRSQKPILLAGGGIHVAGAEKELTDFAKLVHIPVITTIMGRGAIDTRDELYVGNIGMHGDYAANQAISQCDLLFSIGVRFNDRITGKLSEFAPNAAIVHIDIDTASISRNIQVDVPIVADAKKALDQLLSYDYENKLADFAPWWEQIHKWEKEVPLSMENQHKDGEGLLPEQIIKGVNEEFTSSIVVTDVGQHQMWTTQFIQLNEKKKLLTSGGLGTMGYGLPGAIGAQIGNPDKKVICVTGDGGMQMNIQELATAVTCQLPIIILILNNSYLGMVRQWQQLFYEKRYSSTCLRHRRSCEEHCGSKDHCCPPYTPDFVKLAESYGVIGYRAFTEEQFREALSKGAKEEKTPVLIECMLDPELLVLPMVRSGNPIYEMILC